MKPSGFPEKYTLWSCWGRNYSEGFLVENWKNNKKKKFEGTDFKIWRNLNFFERFPFILESAFTSLNRLSHLSSTHSQFSSNSPHRSQRSVCFYSWNLIRTQFTLFLKNIFELGNCEVNTSCGVLGGRGICGQDLTVYFWTQYLLIKNLC